MDNEKQTSIFEQLGFNETKALEILQNAKNAEINKDKKTALIKQASEGVVFMKASEYDTTGYYDKPECSDVYALLYTYQAKKSTQVTALYKKSSFFKALALMSVGSKLSETINNVLGETATA